MTPSIRKLTAFGAGVSGRDILGAALGLLGLAALTLLNPAGATASKAPSQPAAISARVTTSAAALPRATGTGAPAAPVEFKLWARSSLGPLNVVVVSRSSEAP